MEPRRHPAELDCSSFIYLIRCESPEPFYKIGYALNPEMRLKELQVGCPYKLTLVDSYPGGVKEETSIHRKFKNQQVSGEWFRLTDKELRRFGLFKEAGSTWYTFSFSEGA